MYLAVHTQNLEIVSILIDFKANVNLPQIDNETPLHVAVKKNNSELVDLLLENGADTNVKTSGNLQTALHYAFINNVNSSIIISLINYGGIVDCLDSHGNKPFNYANSAETIKYALLIKEDLKKLALANITHPTNYGTAYGDSTFENEPYESTNSFGNFYNTNDTKNNSFNITSNTLTELNSNRNTERNTERTTVAEKSNFSLNLNTLNTLNTLQNKDETSAIVTDRSAKVTDREAFSEMNPVDTNK